MLGDGVGGLSLSAPALDVGRAICDFGDMRKTRTFTGFGDYTCLDERVEGCYASAPVGRERTQLLLFSATSTFVIGSLSRRHSVPT
jgi:hypothetical protein